MEVLHEDSSWQQADPRNTVISAVFLKCQIKEQLLKSHTLNSYRNCHIHEVGISVWHMQNSGRAP